MALSKTRKREIAKLARKNRPRISRPRYEDIIIAKLTTMLIELNRLVVVPRGNEPIAACRDHLTVWNGQAQAFNHPDRNNDEGHDWLNEI